MGFPTKTPGSRAATDADFDHVRTEGYEPQIAGQGIGKSTGRGKLHPLTGAETAYAGEPDGVNHAAEHGGNGLIRAMHAHADRAHPVMRR